MVTEKGCSSMNCLLMIPTLLLEDHTVIFLLSETSLRPFASRPSTATSCLALSPSCSTSSLRPLSSNRHRRSRKHDYAPSRFSIVLPATLPALAALRRYFAVTRTNRYQFENGVASRSFQCLAHFLFRRLRGHCCRRAHELPDRRAQLGQLVQCISDALCRRSRIRSK